jgi:3-hydroxymyristoyl/3-hydroxydecanoyl-(acyl carrier protein) dehydratase
VNGQPATGLPLLAPRALDSPIAHWRGAAVSTATFVAQAGRLAQRLPEARYCINLAENRFHFLLGWVAACLRGQVTLLPPNQLPAVLDELRREYACHLFDDAVAGDLLESPVVAATSLPAWQVAANQVVAVVFTSGSTGKPQPHEKTWGSLFHNSRLAARDVLGGLERQVVATVPSQHMYGLEASLLGGLTAGCCIHDGKPFFPADVRQSLEALPEPRTLVTTPAHLKVLVAAGVALPPLQRVVSATAPLPVELARQAEASWRTEVFEIYGCTEAGVMAHRRTTTNPRWRTLAGGTVTTVNGAPEYHAPQLPDAVPLQDLVELHGATEFDLCGRASDMIKVAGKRASLQDLRRQVASLPGVEDAAVLVPDEGERPAALVVAPGLDAARILQQLRQTMEPVFVPRPLLVVAQLPRNELGKLPRDALLALYRQEKAAAGESADEVTFVVPATHPALAGHFPGNPLVPGVVLLDLVLAQVRARIPGALRSIPTAKFLAPVRPGDRVRLCLELADTRVRFTGWRDSLQLFTGSFELAAEQPA